MLVISQKVNRSLYIICIATAVFCRTPPSERTKKLSEEVEKRKAGIRMMILITFTILCVLVFICKKFAKTSQQQEIEVVRSFSSEGSPEPAVIPLNSPYDDGDWRNHPLQCNVGLYDHQTNGNWSSAQEDISDINTGPLTPTMLKLDTKSLQHYQPAQQTDQVTKPSDETLYSRMTKQPYQLEQQTDRVKKPSEETLNSRMTKQPYQLEQQTDPVTKLSEETLNSRMTKQPYQSEQQTDPVTTPSVETLNSRMTKQWIAPTTLELEERYLKIQEDEQRPNRVIEPKGSLNHSVEVLNGRITRKQLLEKAMDVMKIGWTSKETSKIAVIV